VNCADQLTQLIQAELVRRNHDLFALKLYRASHRQVIALHIDRCEGGITLDECAQWNRYVGQIIDQHQLIEGPFAVEVSSPGVNWPLKGERDYRRLMGKKILYQVGNEGAPQEAKGRIIHVEKGMLELKDEKGINQKIVIQNIAKAKALV
jgi:ribosome maturation factor RimP